MPELPEVETIARELREENLIGLTIKRSEVYWERTLSNLNSSAFCLQILNQTIQNISRRGKFLVFKLTKDTLLVHLRMTGKFLISKNESPPTSHERIRLYLSDKRILHFEDQRKFGKWHLSSHPEEILKNIGVEPLSPEFTLKHFLEIIKGRHQKAKPFLLDQRYIAGLGNIYVDEALWESQIHPARSLDTLSEKDKIVLYNAIIKVLIAGVENIGTSLGAARANYFSVSGRRGTHQHALKVFRRNGLKCSRCGSEIKKIVLAQRGTHFCPLCQNDYPTS